MNKSYFNNRHFRNWIRDLNEYWVTRYLLFVLKTLIYTLLFGILFILIYKFIYPLFQDFYTLASNYFVKEDLIEVTSLPETNTETNTLNIEIVNHFDYAWWGLRLIPIALIGYIGFSWHQAWVQEWLIQDPDFVFDNLEDIITDLFDISEIINTTPDIFIWSTLIKSTVNYLSDSILTLTNSITSITTSTVNYINSLFTTKDVVDPATILHSPEWYNKVHDTILYKLHRRYDLRTLEPEMVKFYSDFTIDVLVLVKQGNTVDDLIERFGGYRNVGNDPFLFIIIKLYI